MTQKQQNEQTQVCFCVSGPEFRVGPFKFPCLLHKASTSKNWAEETPLQAIALTLESGGPGLLLSDLQSHISPLLLPGS